MKSSSHYVLAWPWACLEPGPRRRWARDDRVELQLWVQHTARTLGYLLVPCTQPFVVLSSPPASYSRAHVLCGILFQRILFFLGRLVLCSNNKLSIPSHSKFRDRGRPLPSSLLREPFVPCPRSSSFRTRRPFSRTYEIETFLYFRLTITSLGLRNQVSFLSFFGGSLPEFGLGDFILIFIYSAFAPPILPGHLKFAVEHPF